jgi:Bacteriophage tail sheath protein
VAVYLAPGVYVEEVPAGPQPIAPASTSVVAIVGGTRRGPVRTPTRVNSWSDFQRMFGGSAGDGFTAEAVYGFFANEGPAAYVVRVDPSVAASWQVRDSADADSFLVAATSPGSWARDLTVSVAPDRTAGAAQLFHTTVKADVTFTGASTQTVQVESSTGVAVGDTVVLLLADNTGTTATGTVTGVAPGALTIQKSGAGNTTLLAGAVVAGRIDGAATQFRLTGTGIKTGDVLQAETGDHTRVSWRVTSAVPQGAGIMVTAAAGAGVAGAQFTNRIARFRGTLPPVTTRTVALSAISWNEDVAFVPADADLTDKTHAWASDGMEGTWTPATNVLTFPAVPPPGPIEVEATLRVTLFGESRTWTNPTPAELTSAYSFVPANTDLKLTGAGALTATVTRTATGFDVTSGSLTGTFTTVEFQAPTAANRGVVVRCARPPEVGDRVRFTNDKIFAITAVDPVGGSLYKLSFAEGATIATAVGRTFDLRAFVPTTFVPLRFRLSVAGSAGGETYPGLALDPAHPQYFARDGVINEVSALITVTARPNTAGPPAQTTMPAYALGLSVGADRPPTAQDYAGGIDALETEPEPAMVMCPDLMGFDDELLQFMIVDKLVTHCERFRRFAILDAPAGPDDKALKWRNTAVASTYAAVFAPHVRIVNLDPTAVDRYRTVPPSGFVAGVMARTDRSRGVHKAPGNERVSGIIGLTEQYTQSRQELLNPNGVNLIRSFPGRGTRIWGARNATDDTTWRYINVRRLFNMVETSVDRGTQWVVFEPNTSTTWLRVKASVEGFLDQLWRAGALAGDSAEQAYRVRIGLGQTMTEADIDLGLVITEVAIAPAKPAEFVVFRFSHKRLSE